MCPLRASERFLTAFRMCTRKASNSDSIRYNIRVKEEGEAVRSGCDRTEAHSGVVVVV